MTVADTIYDTINDNWGGGGYAGAAPTIRTTETNKSNNVVSTDVIEVRHYSLKEDPRPVNDTYTNRYYKIDVHIQSKTTPAQLKLIMDEAEYLLRNTTMTGLQMVNITKDYSVSQWGQAKHAVVLRVEVVALMSDGAVTPAGGTGTGLTGAYMAELLMFGSDNAAWVPCSYETATDPSLTLTTGATIYNKLGDVTLIFRCPLPTTKRSLKLYVSGTKYGLFDADGSNYVTQTTVYGDTYNVGGTVIDVNTTNYAAQAEVEDTWTAVDCSSYDTVHIAQFWTVAALGKLDLTYMTIRCYYDT